MVIKRGNTVIAIIIGVVALIFFVFAIIYSVATAPMQLLKSLGEGLFGGNNTAQAAFKQVDYCGTSVPEIYLPYVKQFARIYLRGDEAVLVAVITRESNFNAKAMSSTGAVGIGQFVAPTAQGLKDSAGLFKGLTITTVPRADKSKKRFVTPAERAAFIQSYPSSGRLQPGPSIEAMAYKMKNALNDQGGDLREAYAKEYHGFDDEAQKAAAYSAADDIVKNYKSIADCKLLKDTPGSVGEDLRKLTASK